MSNMFSLKLPGVTRAQQTLNGKGFRVNLLGFRLPISRRTRPLAPLKPELVRCHAAIDELRCRAACNTVTSGACLNLSLEEGMLPSSLQTLAVRPTSLQTWPFGTCSAGAWKV